MTTNPLPLLVALVAGMGLGSAQGPQASPGAPTSPAAFWDALGDSTLERLVTEVLRSNREVRVADARLRGARAARLHAALDFAPAITANAAYTRQRLAGVTFPGGGGGVLPDQGLWHAGLELSWELDLFGRLRRSAQGHGALVDAAQEDLRDIQVLLAAALAAEYFELRGAQHRLAVARRNAENQRRTLDLTVQRLDAGRGTAFDSERAQAQLSSTLALIPALEATIAAGQYRIGVLVGRPPRELARELADTVPAPALPQPLAPAQWDALALRRPDVQSAERQLAAAGAFVGAAQAEYLPKVVFGGAAGYSSDAFGGLDNSVPRYAIGPVLSWPALNLGRVKAGVDAARAREAGAAAQYEQTRLRALEEMETSVVAYAKARQSLEHLAAAAAAGERAAELARLRFEEGATDFLEVLDAERTMLEAQDRLAAGRTGAATSLVAVYRALGGAAPQEAELR